MRECVWRAMLLWMMAARVLAQEPADWVAKHAQPLHGIEPGEPTDDLRPIKDSIGTARVVAFSEGWHASHDFLAFRNRLFAYLVQEGGITAYAGETGFTDSVAVEDYVLGRTEYTDEAARAVFAWGDRSMEENRQLVQWLRAYNDRPTTRRKVRFYGIDLTGGGDFLRAPLAVEAVLGFIQSVDPALGARLRSRFEPALKRFNTKGYPLLAPADRAALTAVVADLIRLFEANRLVWIRKSSSLAFERAYHNAVVVRELNEMFRNSLLGIGVEAAPTWADREPGMSENLRWVLEREGPRGRIFMFEQVGHVAKRETRDRNRPDRQPVGAYLHSILGDDYVNIAGLWGSGTVGWPGSLRSIPYMGVDIYEALTPLLLKVATPLYFLDLHGMPALAGPRFKGTPSDVFDSVVFFRTIGPLQTPSSTVTVPK